MPAPTAGAMSSSPSRGSLPISPSCSSSSSSTVFRLHCLNQAAFARILCFCRAISTTRSNSEPSCVLVRAVDGKGFPVGTSGDSGVQQLALSEEPDTARVAPSFTKQVNKTSPLEHGGTLPGDQAAGKDPGLAALGRTASSMAVSGPFKDPRWKNGNWDIQQFVRNGKVDWDAVIDAEVVRRKWLEKNPEPSSNEDPVVFDTSMIPWWAWVKRFYLREAEIVNGRAAMIGFFMAYVIDGLTGVGLVDQTRSFFGKLLLLITMLGILLIRKIEDVETLKQFVKEWNLYDKQWQAAWQDDQGSSDPETDK